MNPGAMATTEQVGADPVNDGAPAVMADHCAHVSAFVRNEHLRRQAELRDEFVRIASDGRFVDAASREWRGIPMVWRMALVMMAGAGDDTESLENLASREWREMPPPERESLRGIVRGAKKHLGRLTALAARV
ncbi:hypothetical protein QF021_000252 [Acidovorax delafieldii]|nr:hypothetical protein [Acidovorax delafieldii]